MTQLHKQFSTDQVRILLTAYEQGHLSREEIEHTLGIGKTRFFALLKQMRTSPDTFSLDYHRQSRPRLTPEAEEKIHQELLREKALVEDKDLPISGYNYAALTDRLEKQAYASRLPQ
jgi:transposase